MKTYSVVIIGAERRGSTYANEMLKLGNKFKVVGVADPIKERRDLIQNKFHFNDDMCFNSWEYVLAKPKMADIALICTMDEMHYPAAMKAIELGYDIILENTDNTTITENYLTFIPRVGFRILDHGINTNQYNNYRLP